MVRDDSSHPELLNQLQKIQPVQIRPEFRNYDARSNRPDVKQVKCLVQLQHSLHYFWD